MDNGIIDEEGTVFKNGVVTGRVLLVDDHQDTLALVERVLRRAGFEVVTADGVASAERVAATEAWDVLVTDLKLHDGTGWDLLARLRASRTTAFASVAVSGLAYPSDLEQSKRAGFCAHLTKPIDIPTVVETVRRCVAEAAERN